jgi:hypothetical protein
MIFLAKWFGTQSAGLSNGLSAHTAFGQSKPLGVWRAAVRFGDFRR